MKNKEMKELKKSLKKKPKSISLRPRDYISTGSTMLNLACSGKPECGFAKGKYYFIVGDSASGKTFLTLTCLAEASINKHFKDYRYIYDNSEDGALMDMSKFFGEKVAAKLEPPSTKKEDGETIPIYSSTIEEFYYHADDALKQGKPFIYILDSMDSLSSKSEGDKFEETKRAYRKGNKTAGSFGDGKARMNSMNLRRLLTPLRKSGSILIIISQTRDNLGISSDPKTRSGGKSLRFYACLEIWSSIIGRIKKTVKGKERQLGIKCKLQIKKNRLSGKERTVVTPIYYSIGIDDIGSCIDYLIEEGHWKGTKGKVIAPEFNFEGSIVKLIHQIEKENMEKDLKLIVNDVWNEIEEACEVQRKRRY